MKYMSNINNTTPSNSQLPQGQSQFDSDTPPQTLPQPPQEQPVPQEQFVPEEQKIKAKPTLDDVKTSENDEEDELTYTAQNPNYQGVLDHIVKKIKRHNKRINRFADDPTIGGNLTVESNILYELCNEVVSLE